MSDLPAPRRVSRLGLYLPFAILLLICAGWTTFWFVSSGVSERTLDSWISREAALGRVWTCPKREIGGFPFDLAVSCVNPSFEGRVGTTQLLGQSIDGPIHGEVKLVRALAQIYRPTLILIEVEGPLRIITPNNGPQVEATWTHLRTSLHGTPAGLARVSLTLETPQISVTQAGQTFGAQAQHFEFHVRHNPQRPVEDQAYDIAFDLKEALVPQLSRLLRSDAALNAASESTLSRAEFTGVGTPADRLEAWRAAGGMLDVTRFVATQGKASVAAKGQLSIDPQHRPQGNMDMAFTGLSPLLAQFGVPVGAVAIDNLLGGLFGGKNRNKDGNAAPKDQISLPVSLSNGRVQIGPLGLPALLQPLY